MPGLGERRPQRPQLGRQSVRIGLDQWCEILVEQFAHAPAGIAAARFGDQQLPGGLECFRMPSAQGRAAIREMGVEAFGGDVQFAEADQHGGEIVH